MMVQDAPSERRMYPRYPLPTSVQFHHGPSRRDFPARCANISEGGMLMYVPVTSPVQPGHPISVTIGSVSRPEFAALSERPVDATIVRVDREALLEEAHLAVALRFAK